MRENELISQTLQLFSAACVAALLILLFIQYYGMNLQQSITWQELKMQTLSSLLLPPTNQKQHNHKVSAAKLHWEMLFD